MWQPLMDAATSRECWIAIEDIERCLIAYFGDDEKRDAVLASGDAGIALFFAYLDAVRPGADSDERALESLARSLHTVTRMYPLPGFYVGFSGVAWVVEHLSRQFFESDDEVSGHFHHGLRAFLSSANGNTPYELMEGLAGFGTYLIERLPHEDAAESLADIIDRLDAEAEKSDSGVTWFTPPEWLTMEQRRLMPRGCYNFGVAHGVPGVIGFLAAARRENLDDARVAHLAEGAIRWALARKLERCDESVFPAFAAPDQTPVPTRTAWCYGDLGVAAVLLSAARSFDREDWEQEALALARLAARRSVTVTQAIDPGLCHGAIGLAHIFNRFHQATRDEEMRRAALAWYGRALDMRRPGEGLAGLSSWVRPPGGEGAWRGEHGFLTGIAGFGLGLLAAVSDVEPAWDRALLIAVPAQGEGR